MELIKKVEETSNFTTIRLESAQYETEIFQVKWGYEILKSVIPTLSLFNKKGRVCEGTIVPLAKRFNFIPYQLISYLKTHNNIDEYFCGYRFNGTSNFDYCFLKREEIIDGPKCPACRGNFDTTLHPSNARNWEYDTVDGVHLPMIPKYSRSIPGRMVKWYEHDDVITTKNHFFGGRSYEEFLHCRFQYGHAHSHLIPIGAVIGDVLDFGLLRMPGKMYMQLAGIQKWFQEIEVHGNYCKGKEHVPFMFPMLGSINPDLLTESQALKVFYAILAIFVINKDEIVPKSFLRKDKLNYILMVDYIKTSDVGRFIHNKLIHDYKQGIQILCSMFDQMYDEFFSKYKHEYQSLDLKAELLSKKMHTFILTKENYDQPNEFYLGDKTNVCVTRVEREAATYFSVQRGHADTIDFSNVVGQDLTKGMSIQLNSRTVMTENTSVEYVEEVHWFITKQEFNLGNGYFWIGLDEVLDMSTNKTKEAIVNLRNTYIKQYRDKKQKKNIKKTEDYGVDIADVVSKLSRNKSNNKSNKLKIYKGDVQVSTDDNTSKKNDNPIVNDDMAQDPGIIYDPPNRKRKKQSKPLPAPPKKRNIKKKRKRNKNVNETKPFVKNRNSTSTERWGHEYMKRTYQ